MDRNMTKSDMEVMEAAALCNLNILSGVKGDWLLLLPFPGGDSFGGDSLLRSDDISQCP